MSGMNKETNAFFPEVTFKLKPGPFVLKLISHWDVSHNMLSPKGNAKMKNVF